MSDRLFRFTAREVDKLNEKTLHKVLLQRLAMNLSLFDKTKCIEMFSDVLIDGKQVYEQRSLRSMLAYKLWREML